MRLGLWHAIRIACGCAPTDQARDRREAELRHTYEQRRMERQRAAQKLTDVINRIGLAENAGEALEIFRGRGDDV